VNVNKPQNAFVFGEISPTMYGRKDLEQYASGVARLENYLVRQQGGLLRRTGSRFCFESPAGHGEKIRIVPFNTSAAGETEKLLLVFGGDSVWAYKDLGTSIIPLAEPPFELIVTSNTAFTDRAELSDENAVGAPNFAGRIGLHANIDEFELQTGMGPYTVRSATFDGGVGLSVGTSYWVVVQTSIADGDYSYLNYDLSMGQQQHQRHYPVYLGFARTLSPTVGFRGYENADRAMGLTNLSGRVESLILDPSDGAGGTRDWVHQVSEDPLDEAYLAALRYQQDGEVLTVALAKNLYQFYYTFSPTGVSRLTMRKVPLGANGPVKRLDAATDGTGLTLTEDSTPNSFTLDRPGTDCRIYEGLDEEAQATLGRIADSPKKRMLVLRDNATSKDWCHVYSAGDLQDGGSTLGPNAFVRASMASKALENWTPGGSLDCDAWALGSVYAFDDALVVPPASEAHGPSPKALAFIQNRIVLAGGYDPNLVCFSGTDGIGGPRFLPIARDGSFFTSASYKAGAFNVAIKGFGEGDREVMDLFELEDDLFVVTRTRVYRLWAYAPEEGLHIANRAVRPVNSFGGSNVQSAKMEDAAVYVSGNGRRLYRVRLGGEEEGYTTEDLTLYADHVLGEGVKVMAHQPDPVPLLWVVKEPGADGVSELVSFTVNRQQLVQGVARHRIGGGGGTHTPSDICVARSGADNEWNAFIVMERRINGQDRVYIEALEQTFKVDRTIDSDCYLDCWASYVDTVLYANVPANTFDYLEGETVGVFGQGKYLGTKTIVNGQFDSDLSENIVPPSLGGTGKVSVGFLYKSRVDTLPQELSLQGGGATDQELRAPKVAMLSLYKSYGGAVGALDEVGNQVNLDRIEFPEGSVLAAKQLFTGSRHVEIDGDTNREGRLSIEIEEPYPSDINQLVYRNDYSLRGGTNE